MRVPSEVIPIEAAAALATETAAGSGNKATAKAGSRQAGSNSSRAKKFKVWVIKNVAAAAAAQQTLLSVETH